MRLPRCFPLYLLMAGSALLGACGGGGDSAGSLPNTTYNAAAAWQNLLTKTNAYTVSGVASDGNTYRLALNISSGGTAVFPVTGVTANKTNLASTVSRNGVTLQSGLVEAFYDGSFLELGTRTAATGETPTCEAGVSAASPSTVATTGASGSLSTRHVLDGCASTSNVIATTTETWSIELHDGIAYFCTNATTQDTATPPNISTEQDCLETAVDGSLGARARITLTGSGVTLVATN